MYVYIYTCLHVEISPVIHGLFVDWLSTHSILDGGILQFWLAPWQMLMADFTGSITWETRWCPSS